MKVGSLLRKRRRQIEMSVAALAASTGLSRAAITNIEHGKVDPLFSSVDKICKALGVGYEFFVQSGSVEVQELQQRD